MRIVRIFPRRTRATPSDPFVRVGVGPGFYDEADEVHVSATFTWDLPEAERLANLWRAVAPVRIGGPATGEPGGEFESGKYLKTRLCHHLARLPEPLLVLFSMAAGGPDGARVVHH